MNRVIDRWRFLHSIAVGFTDRCGAQDANCPFTITITACRSSRDVIRQTLVTSVFGISRLARRKDMPGVPIEDFAFSALIKVL
jgi:hypothetical protein